MKCFFCDKPSVTVRYIVVPGYIMVPNSYIVCDNHKDKQLQFDEIYNEDGSRKEYKDVD